VHHAGLRGKRENAIAHLGPQVGDLAAKRQIHGAELIADNSQSDQTMCQQFEHWVEQCYPTSGRRAEP